MIYGIKWQQLVKPSWKGATLEDATETVEKTKTFESEKQREAFYNRLRMTNKFKAVTDWWAED